MKIFSITEAELNSIFIAGLANLMLITAPLIAIEFFGGNNITELYGLILLFLVISTVTSIILLIVKIIIINNIKKETKFDDEDSDLDNNEIFDQEK